MHLWKYCDFLRAEVKIQYAVHCAPSGHPIHGNERQRLRPCQFVRRGVAAQPGLSEAIFQAINIIKVSYEWDRIWFHSNRAMDGQRNSDNVLISIVCTVEAEASKRWYHEKDAKFNAITYIHFCLDKIFILPSASFMTMRHLSYRNIAIWVKHE